MTTAYPRKHDRAPAHNPLAMPNDQRFRVTVLPTQLRFEADSQQSLLNAALRAAVGLRSSCRNGTCRACICRVVSGEVVHQIEWPGLSAEEKRDGYVLPCVAMARSDVVLQLPG